MKKKKKEKPLKVAKAKVRVNSTQPNAEVMAFKAVLDYYQNNKAKFIGAQIITNR